MGLTVQEQETTVNFYRDSDLASIYTSDRTVITKLDKLVESDDSPDWKLLDEVKDQNGEIVGKTYETKKKLISFRSKIIRREYSEEELEVVRERMRNVQRKMKERKE